MPYPNPRATDQPYGAQVGFTTQGVFPPSALYVSRDDVLQLSVHNPGTATTLSLSLRFLSPDGEVHPELYTFAPASVGNTPQLFTVQHAEGFLISASLFGTNAARGQVFVQLYLKHGVGSGDTMLGHILLQGYVSADDFLGFPQSPVESALNGRGALVLSTVANPAAGAQWSFTVPQGVRYELKSVRADFIANATVLNRVPALRFTDSGGNNFSIISWPAVVTASQIPTLTAGPGLTGVSNAVVQTVALHNNLLLGPGYVIDTNSTVMAAGDQWQNIRILTEQWIAH